jgi:hypothetical protein
MTGRFVLLLACWCALLAGCPQRPLEVSPLLDAVLADKVAFRPSEDNTLLDIDPGTPIDDVEAGIVGCWGNFLDDDGTALITLSNAMRFGADGTYEAWTLQNDVLGLLPFLSGGTGTYQVLDERRVRILIERSWTQSPCGDLQETEVSDPEGVRLVTVDGDSAILVPHYTEDPNSVAPADYIYYICRKFECP